MFSHHLQKAPNLRDTEILKTSNHSADDLLTKLTIFLPYNKVCAYLTAFSVTGQTHKTLFSQPQLESLNTVILKKGHLWKKGKCTLLAVVSKL